MEIEKRKTEDKEDEVYCSFVIQNEEYRIEGQYNCEYEYYDVGGWVLENSYTTDTQISIITDELPDFISENIDAQMDLGYLSQSYMFRSYDIQNVDWEKNVNQGYVVTFDIAKNSDVCNAEGEYHIFYNLKGNGSLAFEWYTEREEGVTITETWNPVGKYYGKNLGHIVEIEIDSYDPDTQEVHVVSYKNKQYQNDKEMYDFTANAFLLDKFQPYDEVELHIPFLDNESDCLVLLRGRPYFSGVDIEKIE